MLKLGLMIVILSLAVFGQTPTPIQKLQMQETRTHGSENPFQVSAKRAKMIWKAEAPAKCDSKNLNGPKCPSEAKGREPNH